MSATLHPMNSLATYIARVVLSRVLRRACPYTIPRSGAEGEGVNCFVTTLDAGEKPPFVVLHLGGDELQCLAWDGQSYGSERRVPLRNVELSKFQITHFYGLSDVQYSGLLDFILNRVTAWPYIKIHIVRVVNRIDRYFFNKKKLITKQRMDLLKILIQRHLDGQSEFDPISLMTDLYSLRWVEHPDRDSLQHKLEFYLDSMVETGELRKITYKYQVTGKALHAIEEYEEQERKHTENVKMQRMMLWLTLAIAAFTAVQAGLVKLPPLLDLTHKTGNP